MVTQLLTTWKKEKATDPFGPVALSLECVSFLNPLG